MKKNKARIIAISISLIIGISFAFLTLMLLYDARIRNLGGLYLDTSIVVYSIVYICIVGFIVFESIFLLLSLFLK